MATEAAGIHAQRCDSLAKAVEAYEVSLTYGVLSGMGFAAAAASLGTTTVLSIHEWLSGPCRRRTWRLRCPARSSSGSKYIQREAETERERDGQREREKERETRTHT
eukprot:GHVU01050238.1.p3 GENE.GHVU01050238.1~~GHVU01050238.1.p3  ORF type:complete len:107 (-),score=7.42 GHVU01050238.1:611-931(-)